MRRTNTVIIGGGQAGLAMSKSLSDRSISHVILERGQVGERWKKERWDSLRLLTPKWQTRLPGLDLRGDDGFMSKDDLAAVLDDYARQIDAPVETNCEVTAVALRGTEYRVSTNRGVWYAGNVVIATGHCHTPWVPEMASELLPEVRQMVTTEYKNPSQLAEGGVLVVGASSTGIQLAHEIQESGRQVTLSVGTHTRVPRRYRGRDIMWWLDAMGFLDERATQVSDLDAARLQPSLQLIGSPDGRSIDLNTLMDAGVRLVGHARDARGTKVWFNDDLRQSIEDSEERLTRLLSKIDAYIKEQGMEKELPPAEAIQPVRVPSVPSSVDLKAAGIKTVLWATGYKRTYPWLQVPVLDENGEVEHTGGVTPEPGLYVLGLMLMRRRKSTFVDGVGQDAAELASHIEERNAALSATDEVLAGAQGEMA